MNTQTHSLFTGVCVCVAYLGANQSGPILPASGHPNQNQNHFYYILIVQTKGKICMLGTSTDT